MRVVSHRGNTTGPGSLCERSFVERALADEYDVEVDVRCDGGMLTVGHDASIYELPVLWTKEPTVSRLWYHAKDEAAMTRLASINVRRFAHDAEASVLVYPERYAWIHPKYNEILVPNGNSVILDIIGYPRVVKELLDELPFAVCTDWCGEWKEWLESEAPRV